ncbi:hypothetical protein FGO68_gene10526 [Halteria grandinella]|uniref:Uncharacterized protein n=1 Tax=Halteria grandinella TaxID=5974 RepID=A0A8J8P6C3_HALGN|nr:hypothetical protein FGO68_gene10526 [Halteria grandinella]
MLRDFVALQLMSLYLLSLSVQATLVFAKPYEDPKDNKASLFNEAMVTLYLYFLIPLTDFNTYRELRETNGLCLISIVFWTLFANIAMAGVKIARACKMRGCCRQSRAKPEDKYSNVETFKGQDSAQAPINIPTNIIVQTIERTPTAASKVDPHVGPSLQLFSSDENWKFLKPSKERVSKSRRARKELLQPKEVKVRRMKFADAKIDMQGTNELETHQ